MSKLNHRKLSLYINSIINKPTIKFDNKCLKTTNSFSIMYTTPRYIYVYNNKIRSLKTEMDQILTNVILF